MSELRIEVLWSLAPRAVQSLVVVLADGADVSAATRAWAQAACIADEHLAQLKPSIWGEAAKPQRLLQAGDRLEFSRGLRVDPKVARRERFAKQGTRGTGLFAKLRPGGKRGY